MGIQAWYMDDSDVDQREEHQPNTPEYVDEEYLTKHGILHWKVNSDDYNSDETYTKIKADRGYTLEKVKTFSRDELPEYDTKIKRFFEEHLHTYEEVRLCLEGGGYYDFRDYNDRWVRIKLSKGDFLIIPTGIYHRFTVDNNNFVKMVHLFVGEHPVGGPRRPAGDDIPARSAYLQKIIPLVSAASD